MPVYADPTDGLVVPVKLLLTWTAGLVESWGAPPDIAADVAEVLVASDARGIASHGTARLPNYLALIDAGVMDPAARPRRVGGRPALLHWDGMNGWGHHAGRVAVDAASEAGRELGDVPVTPYREAIAATAAIFSRLASDGRLVGAEHVVPTASAASSA